MCVVWDMSVCVRVAALVTLVTLVTVLSVYCDKQLYFSDNKTVHPVGDGKTVHADCWLLRIMQSDSRRSVHYSCDR